MSFAYITEEGACIQKRGGVFVVGRNRETIMEIPEEVLEGLVLVGNVQVSSRAMTELLRLGIPVTWLSHTGRFFGRLESTQHVQVFRQEKQVLQRGSAFALSLAKKCIAGKVHNQLTILRRYIRYNESPEFQKAVRQILALRKHIFQSETSEQLMGYEGIMAREYFQALGRMVPPAFAFSVRSKQPPLDAFNAMLSLGYTLLLYEIYTALGNEGLHPYFGFFHALKNRHPALASDLLEEWRAVIVDSMVLSLVHRHEIKPEHFEKNEDGTPGVFLTREGRAIFFRAYEKKMRTKNKYMEGSHSYRHTIGRQVAQYAQAMMAQNLEMYEPIFLR
ncbi:MAG: CRISPR-associated endonuclease Cas1 [Mitsuokella sp.]